MWCAAGRQGYWKVMLNKKGEKELYSWRFFEKRTIMGFSWWKKRNMNIGRRRTLSIRHGKSCKCISAAPDVKRSSGSERVPLTGTRHAKHPGNSASYGIGAPAGKPPAKATLSGVSEHLARSAQKAVSASRGRACGGKSYKAMTLWILAVLEWKGSSFRPVNSMNTDSCHRGWVTFWPCLLFEYEN